MSHEENDKFLEDAYQRAEEAVVNNDTDAFSDVYFDMVDKGFTKEAEDLADTFGILSV